MSQIGNKMIALIIVAVVLVAGIGFALLSNGSDADDYRSTNDSGRLMVYGNANNDDYIDGEDVAMLQSILTGEESADDHAFADANQDGEVTQADVDWVKRMVNRESMKIYYLNARDEVKAVDYPVDDVVVAGTNMLTAMKSIGAVEKMVGISGGTRDATLFSDILNLTYVSDSTFKVDSELLSTIPHVGAIVTMDSSAYVDNEEVFTDAGIEVIRMAASSGLKTINGLVTLGYMLDLEDNANAYARFCDETLAFIESKVGDGTLTDAERVTSLSVTMSNYVGGTISDYTKATEVAGSINLADWDTTTQRFKIGDEWLYEYDPDFIIHVRSVGYGEVDCQATWDKYSVYFTDLGAYQDGHYEMINGNMPVVVRIAYMATIFYPDIFGEDYGDTVHQEFIDSFMTNLADIGYDVTTDGTFVITSDMVDA